MKPLMFDPERTSVRWTLDTFIFTRWPVIRFPAAGTKHESQVSDPRLCCKSLPIPPQKPPNLSSVAKL